MVPLAYGEAVQIFLFDRGGILASIRSQAGADDSRTVDLQHERLSCGMSGRSTA